MPLLESSHPTTVTQILHCAAAEEAEPDGKDRPHITPLQPLHESSLRVALGNLRSAPIGNPAVGSETAVFCAVDVLTARAKQSSATCSGKHSSKRDLVRPCFPSQLSLF